MKRTERRIESIFEFALFCFGLAIMFSSLAVILRHIFST